MLDGVFAGGAEGSLRFHTASASDSAGVANVLGAIAPGGRRLRARSGINPHDPDASDAFTDASPLLAGWPPRP